MHPNRFTSAVVLLFVLIVGAQLRFAGRNWDAGHHLHPDERFLSMVLAAEQWPESFSEYLDESRSPLNPRNVGFSFFAYGTLPTTVVKGIGVALGQTGFDEAALVGRAASAGASLGSVLLVFLIARRLYNDERIAALAAMLLATAVLPIQHAHFFVVDPFASFFITAAVWALVGPPRAYRYGLAGIFFGLALACKISVATFAVVIGAAALSELFGTATAVRSPRDVIERLARAGGRLAVVAVAAFAAFRLAQPDAFEGPGLLDVMPSARWLANLTEARLLVTGAIDTPPGIQWADRTPFWFAWKNLVLWGLGPALGLVGWAGLGVATWQLLARGARRHLIPVIWTAALFLHQGGQFVMAARYLLPIYPMLALLAAWLLVALWDVAAAHQAPGQRRWPRALAGGLAALVVLGTALWAMAFTSIYRRPNTRVEASAWIYRNVPAGSAVAIEHWDDALPLSQNGRSLQDYAAVQLTPYDDDTPEKLDVLIERLDDVDFVILASNRLYDSIPRLPMRYPMTIRYYESLFSGELGFERVADFTSYPSLGPLCFPDQGVEESLSVYDHARVQIFGKTAAWNPSRARALLGEVDWSSIIRLPPVRARIFRDGLMLSSEARAAVRARGTWSRIFNPDGFANTWPIPVWIVALELLGLAAFPLTALATSRLPDRGWLISKSVGVLLLGYGVWMPASLRWMPFTRSTLLTASAAMAAASAMVVWRRRHDYTRWWATHRSLLLTEECLFWTCFAAFLLIRAGNPDLWHPNFGGEKPMDVAYLNAVIKSEYFPPYDPWFAGGYLNYYYFGFVLVAALVKLTGIVPQVAYNLAIPTFFALTAAGTFTVVYALASALDTRPRSPGRRGAFAFVHGIVGLVMVAVLGNLVELRLVFQALLNRSRSIVPNWSWYWTATRAIPHPTSEAPPITEFPFFTFLYGDLHAHMMGLPYTLLALALVVCLVLPRPDGETSPPASEPALLGLLALTIGALFPLNAWDYPTYVLIVAAGLLLRSWLRRVPEQSVGRILRSAAARLAIVLVAGRLLFAPFFAHYSRAYGSISLWNGSRSTLAAYLSIHGVFLFVIASALAWLVASRFAAVRRNESAAAPYLLVGTFAAVGVALTVFVELIVLAGDIDRMNTVFKFYFQVWVLLGVAAAASLAMLVRAWLDRPTPRPQRLQTVAAGWLGIFAGLGLGGALYPVLATRARWQDRFPSDAGFTLNGQLYMSSAVHTEANAIFALRHDLEAIEWLRAHVTGTPVIVEAHTPEYRWGSRVSIHTGLPTIVGWRVHQTQQRAALPASVIDRRIRDLFTIYTSPDAVAVTALLDRYRAEYVYVGPLERILYGTEGLAKFENQPQYWRTAYQGDEVTIYQVRR